MMLGPVKLRASVREGMQGEVRVLLPHPMESGLRRDAAGALIGADFLTRVSVSVNGRLVIEAGLGPSVAANPQFAFLLEGVSAGDRVSLAWHDNEGRGGSAETLFA